MSSTTSAGAGAAQAAAPPALPMMVVPDLMTARLESTPDAVAFNVDGEDGPTFAAWDRRATSVAHGLLARGASTGTRLALLFDGMDWEQYAVAYLGLLKAGATAVHLNTGLAPAEVARRLAQCRVAGIVHAPALAPPEGFEGWTATPAELDSGITDPVPVEISPLDISDIHYTSGTTGAPKAYQVPHGNLTYGRTPGWFKQFGGAEPMLVPMVLGTGTSATVINIALSSPALVVLVDPRAIERMGELVAALHVGSMMLTPVIALDIIESGLTERHDMSSVHTLACGSAPLAPATANRLLELFPGAKISTAASQSEAGPALVVNVYDPAFPTSVGRPNPITELQITDEQGEPVPVGTVGEIWLRTPAPKRTYLDLPEITDRLMADGWHRTGDLGRLDEEGRLHLFDRAVDVIRVGGTMISSLEVEGVAYGCPGVRECAAIGVPDPVDGQRVVLFVRLAPGTEQAELEAHLDARLDERRRPVRIVQTGPLPRTLNGKVLKRELRSRLEDPAAS